ncbi:MAG: hypothetical protein LM587_03360 [Candidatus Aenigmarchaeota archaeon]|nr:hypothetical protein [Candidatus Aenigmarchaeota archaeon]
MIDRKSELSEEEMKRIEEAWDRAAEKFWKTLEYWKKHNPKNTGSSGEITKNLRKLLDLES